MDNQITNMAMSLKSILQSSFSKRKLEYEDTIISQQYQDNKSSTDSHETDVIYSSPLMKKRCLSSSENNPHQHEHQVLEFSNPTEVALNYFSEEKDSNPTATYESAVMKYRQLRNEIPLLTGAAYDVDAATTELNDHINYVEIASSNGPLIKRPPPGRGRRSALSIINTPLPYQVSENLKNYKKTKLHRTPFEEKRQCRILFIDDSLVTLRLTAKRLQNAGFNVETSTNGIDALNILKGEGNNQRYDIVLADINMPIMNGTEVNIRFLHSSPLSTHIDLGGYCTS